MLRHLSGDRRAQRLMPDAGEQEHLVRTSGGEQGAGHPQGVDGMDIGVGQTMNQEERSGELRCRENQGIRFIPFRELIRMTEEPLAPVGVVEPLLGDARSGQKPYSNKSLKKSKASSGPDGHRRLPLPGHPSYGRLSFASRSARPHHTS